MPLRLSILFPLLLTMVGLVAQVPLPPSNMVAKGYESHIAVSWQASTSTNISSYKIFRATDGSNFEFLKNVSASTLSLTDWTGDEGQNLSRCYQIQSIGQGGQESIFTTSVCANTQVMSDEALLDMVQEQTFRYFWEHAHPVSGMARERLNSGQTVTIGGTGFGIMSIVVASERGWITRAAAVNRLLQIVSFLQVADRFHGAFPHWMDGTTGNTIAFSQKDDGADLVETAFLIQGLLAARQYFDQNTALENALRDVIKGIWEDVEWDWFRKNNSNVLYWHWSPNYNWEMNFPLRGFNETQIVYLLAAASPTHGVPGSLYQTGWTASNYANNSIHFGHKVYCGPFGGGPMFFAHYSYLGFDPRPVKDAFCNYFIRNRNHALIQHAYSVANPKNYLGYSGEAWGLTACDGPNGYSAHDIFPSNDKGTIAPTAALASMPYTPDQSIAAMRHFYRVLGEKLWGEYGFYDAYNLNQNWFATSYLAIDQGPIVVMIENYRTGLLWKKFMLNPEIQPALTALGFQPDNTVNAHEGILEKDGFDLAVYPNPVASNGALNMELSILKAQNISLTLLDEKGQLVQVLAQNKAMPIGVHTLSFPLNNVPKGVYFLEINGQTFEKWSKKILIIND